MMALSGCEKGPNEPAPAFDAPGENEMVLVEGGTFMMGSDMEDALATPVHEVTLGDFYIGKYEVTQAQWEAVTGESFLEFIEGKEGAVDWGHGDNHPMYGVNWNDAQEFIAKLNAATDKNYRLPTEAEWEYAARGGQKSKGYTYSGSDNADDVMWYSGNAAQNCRPVGKKLPNELGIHDMSGSAWEWCNDFFGDYSADPQVDPQGPTSNRDNNRVQRGGSFNSLDYTGTPVWRKAIEASYRGFQPGFRLVLSK